MGEPSLENIGFYRMDGDEVFDLDERRGCSLEEVPVNQILSSVVQMIRAIFIEAGDDASLQEFDHYFLNGGNGSSERDLCAFYANFLNNLIDRGVIYFAIDQTHNEVVSVLGVQELGGAPNRLAELMAAVATRLDTSDASVIDEEVGKCTENPMLKALGLEKSLHLAFGYTNPDDRKRGIFEKLISHALNDASERPDLAQEDGGRNLTVYLNRVLFEGNGLQGLLEKYGLIPFGGDLSNLVPVEHDNLVLAYKKIAA